MQIEGRNAVKEALDANLTINKVMVDKNLRDRKDPLLFLLTKSRIKIEYLPKNVLDKKSATAHHQGFIAQCVDFAYSTEEDIFAEAEKKGEDAFIVLLDGIEDPHNFGAIIRSCECAGVHGIIIPKNRACTVNETVIRTSTGAALNMKIARVTNLKDSIKSMQDRGIWVYCAEVGGKDIYKENLNKPIAVVIGSEGKGIKPTIKNMCDGILTLPLKGNVNSLNASVACGIVIFEVLRQKSK